MISEVPIGFFLSGGIDSSIVVAEASRASEQINTYTIGFDIVSHNETQFAEIVAKKFKSNHQTKILDVGLAGRLVPRMKEWYDEPFGDTSALPSFLISQFAKETCTVVLTGDGGDEVFGGYERYEKYIRLSKFHIDLPIFVRKMLSKAKFRNRYSFVGKLCNRIEYVCLKDLELYAKLLGGLLKIEKTDFAKQFSIPDDYDDYWYFRKYIRNDLPPLKRLQYLDFHTYLPDDILTKVDRVSMSVGLEARVPFLSTDIVTFAFSLPENILFANNQMKGLLRYAFKDVLPDSILNRSKRGFNIPLSAWNKDFLDDAPTQQERLLQVFLK
jgi:asparagine synthase (glutamine-hydrolysing)